MAISEWLDRREMTGFPTFSFEEVRKAFPTLSAQVISNELYRQNKLRRIQTVHKGFYTVVPMQYRDRGVVPPYNYIDQLMRHLRKPYYIALLSAGVLHGAAHQRPMKMAIMTTLPRLSAVNNKELYWCYRTELPKDLLCSTNSDTSIIQYSCAELTATDLVQYSQHIGGLSAAATVIEELSETLDFTKNGRRILQVSTLTTLQRLGYILEEITQNTTQAEILYSILSESGRQMKWSLLTSEGSDSNCTRNEKWKIIVNKPIEPDDIW
ncbi:MAG: type IV toxin-antitoxin system AbiEi family antitoxin [Bacteroidales bacterium]|nr:type IV toxin-antitoxin system AbiEi family antitoxin [Bacteroidales bacterium]